MRDERIRFLKNGTYESILKVAKQWAIIDIRNNKKGAPIKNELLMLFMFHAPRILNLST